MQTALITGASSGIGREMARILSDMGFSLILIARRGALLDELKNELKTPCKTISADLSDINSVKAIFEENPDIDILINNAGFGVFGEFTKTDFERELNMINVNITALHLLTKLYLESFKKKNSGRILNVASSAAFFPGPMFSSYYASKAYVMRLSTAIREELRRENSRVTVSVLCPGPVRTEFNDVAGVNFGIGSISARQAALAGINGMMKGKRIIVPGFGIKCTRILSKLTPEYLSARIVYKMQKAKEIKG